MPALRARQQKAAKLNDAYWVDGTLTDEREYQRLRQQLNERIAATREALDRAAARAGRAALPASSDEARRLWGERGLEWRRLLIEAVVDKVLVGPGVRGLNKFDPRRVVIVWKHVTEAPELPWTS